MMIMTTTTHTTRNYKVIETNLLISLEKGSSIIVEDNGTITIKTSTGTTTHPKGYIPEVALDVLVKNGTLSLTY